MYRNNQLSSTTDSQPTFTYSIRLMTNYRIKFLSLCAYNTTQCTATNLLIIHYMSTTIFYQRY